MDHQLAFHETVEIHELLNFKTIGLTKAKMMQGLVFDRELKALMQQEVEQSIKDINQLQRHYTKPQLQ